MPITGEERAISKNRRRRNADHIRKYLTVVEPKLERQTGGATLNMQEIASSGSKPESKPPMPEYAIGLVDHPDNRDASAKIRPAMGWLAETHGHLHYVARRAINDPAQTRTWAAGETEEDQVQQRMFDLAIAKLEEYIEWRYEEPRIEVAYDPEDEPANSRREAYERGVKRDARHAYEILAAKVDDLVDGEYSKSAAVQAVAESEDTSPARVWRALAYRRESA